MAQHLALVGKGREIGRTSEDRDSVVQFGNPLCERESTHLLPPSLTRLKSCAAVQFGNCRRPDILKPNLISTTFPFPLQPMCTNYNIAHQPYILSHLVFYNFYLSEDELIACPANTVLIDQSPKMKSLRSPVSGWIGLTPVCLLLSSGPGSEQWAQR